MSDKTRLCFAGVLMLLSSCGDLQPVSLGSDRARTRAGASGEHDAGPAELDASTPERDAHDEDDDEEESVEDHDEDETT